MDDQTYFLINRKLGQIKKRKNFIIEYFKEYSDHVISIDPDIYRYYQELEELLGSTKKNTQPHIRYSNNKILKAVLNGKRIIEEQVSLDINNNLVTEIVIQLK